MKARPILCNTDMVKAILAGRKTQTRREVKPQPPHNSDSAIYNPSHFEPDRGWYWRPEGGFAKCPFGQPGDLLYVRETFRLYDSSMECACYDPCTCSRHHGKPMYFADGFSAKEELKWKPSIHMSREFSRLTLEITDVRVERLQEISEADAWKDGGFPVPDRLSGQSYRSMFKDLWDSIYGNWSTNPWVWVVEFKVHHCNVDALLREREG